MILRRARVLLVAFAFVALLLNVRGNNFVSAASLGASAQLQLSGINQNVMSTPGTDPAVAAASQTFTGGQFFEAASASGSATFGTLTGVASATAVAPDSCSGGPGFCGNVLGRSGASFTDFLTITGGTGGLAFVAATGTSTGTGTAELVLNLFDITSATGGQCVAFNAGSCTTPLAHISPGTNTLSLNEQLIVDALARLASGGSVTVTSDFSHTGLLSTIHGFDVNGNELTDFTVTSESGFDYPTGPLNATPEPATLVLCGTTLAAGLGWTGRRRR